MYGEGLHSAQMQAGEAEIGYWIGRPFWGQGLIPEAVRRLLQRCFEELGFTAVWCGYYDGNTKSRRVWINAASVSTTPKRAIPPLWATSAPNIS